MFYDNIKSHKKQGFTLSLENTVLEKPHGWLGLRPLRNQEINRTNNHKPCLHCLQHNPKKWDFEIFMTRIVTFSASIFKES